MRHNARTDEDDRWAGMDVQGDDPRGPGDGARNPFDPAADPEEHAAWETAAATAAENERRVRAELAVEQEAGRQLIYLRGRHRAEDRFRVEQAAQAKAALADNAQVHDGAEFLLDLPPIPPAVWGSGEDILWARGESLMIAGPQGVGKTTLAGQLLRAALGLMNTVLGLPFQPCTKRAGYLAMDRPDQARRALGRLFNEEEREYLAEVLRFWAGPPPTDMAVDPETLVRLAHQLDVDILFVDSLKDAAIGLSKDEVGAGYNRARQLALAEGIQLVELHHIVKNSADGKAPRYLKDVYGSTWLTSGAGSVIMLWGEAGDPVVEFHHLKQPMSEVGPFKILHDPASGQSSIVYDDETDVVAMARRCRTGGLSAREAAICLFSTDSPTRAQIEKSRRRLAKLVADGLLVARPVSGHGPGTGDRWFAAAPTSWTESDSVSDDEDTGERYR